MSQIGSTVVATSAYGIVEDDLVSGIWAVIVGARAELFMFAVAMVAYSVLFMQRAPKNPKNKVIEKDIDGDTFSCAATLRTSAGRNSPTTRSNYPDIAKQINLIRSCAAEKNLQGAFTAFQGLERSGVEMNCIMYNTVLDACVECKDLKEAETWMEHMKSAGMTDVVSFNTLIKAHLQIGNFDKARRLMEMMTSKGFQPNQVTFNELINAIVSRGGDARRKQLWCIIDEMKAADVKPNRVTISILLKCLNYYSSQADISRSMELISNVDEPMDEVLLSSVVEACVRIGKPELLESQLNRLQDSSPITINGPHTYGSLIKAYGHAKDLTSIWRCWKEMRSRHIKPTSITMGCMVEAIVSNGDTEGAYDLIHQIREDEQCCDVVNAIVYCSVLKGFTREKKIDRVWAVYQEMKEMKAELSVILYNTLIDACARCGRMEHLPTLLEDMEVCGAKPNVITYSTMIKGHCQSGDMQSAFRILQQIREDPKLKPDEIMYNSLLDGCAQNRMVSEGLRLLEEMQAEHVQPSNFTLSVLVKLLSRARKLDQAFDLVDEITRRYGFLPNVHVYTNLIQACMFNQQLPRAMSLLERMVGDRIAPDGRTYAVLLRSSMSKGLCDQASGLLRGAIGLPDAPPFLQVSIAACPSLDYSLINEVLWFLAERGRAKDLAVPLLQSIKQNAPKVRIDAVTQRKIMSPCVS